MAAPQTLNASSRGDARYDSRNTTWDASTGSYVDDAGWHYPEQGQYVLSNDRPNTVVSGLPGQDQYDESTGTYTTGGGGSGGGGGGLPPGAAAAIAQELALAKQAYDTALAKITNQRQTLGRNAGFTFDVNADTGMTENMRVDPHAIYGTFQLLNRQQAQNIENARATAIERGLGAGGGLGKQLQTEARFQAGQQDAQFSSQLTDQFTDLATQQQQAKQAYDAAKYQAELDKIRMALANGNYGGGGAPVKTQYSGDPFTNQQNPAVLQGWAQAAAAQNALINQANTYTPAPYTGKGWIRQ